MNVRFGPRSALPVVAWGVGCFLAGVTLTGATLGHYADLRAASAASQEAAYRARISLLESMLGGQTKRLALPDVGASASAPATATVAIATQPLAAETTVAQPTGPGAAAPLRAQPTPTASTSALSSGVTIGAASAPVAASGRINTHTQTPAAPKLPATAAALPGKARVPAAPASGTQVSMGRAAASEPAAADARPVSPQALAAATVTNKIEGVSAAEIGVARIETGAVIMRSGGRVAVGSRFPSGERLLAVDPASQQIITDARTVLVLSD